MASYPRTGSLSAERVAEITEEFKKFRTTLFSQFKSTAQDLDNFTPKCYLEDAIGFIPAGKRRGHDEIRAAFKPYESDGEINVLRSWDESIQICSETRAVVVSGKWQMGSTRGTILLEDWYKQDDGTWKILIECVDILNEK